MSVIKKAYFDDVDGQIHYRSVISQEPTKREPIVFLHMSASTGGQFEKLMKIYSALGHDCYAPDMPGFGGSFDPVEQPPNTGYYVKIYMNLLQSLGLTKWHVLGHHSGASLATEMAAEYPDHILSLCLIGAAIMTREDQVALNAKSNVPFNKPVADGSHLKKTWDYLEVSGIGPDLDLKQQELLNHVRAWDGRIKIYTCVFTQDMWGMFKRVACPILNMCAKDDVLWPYVKYIKEIRPEVQCEEVIGGDFEPARDPEGISGFYTPFLSKV
ncbi:hypothetical protein BP6252_03896 [Coleophoma cylindrospora]|uniref:AB hydrolase-1 domain-containing protein n=1 Tax=Coleophoma cylindrospora TaxID=1849047 RepID=A0A3D8S9J8_9HELO|nr:hypothetical protein BP6252_03896 [Coleophoma cylindrospora]